MSSSLTFSEELVHLVLQYHVVPYVLKQKAVLIIPTTPYEK
jgi:hypothetical protein